VIGRLPLDELEGPGAHRVLRDALAAVLGKRRRRDDHGRGMRQVVDEGREGLAEREAHRARIDHLGLGDVLVEVVALELVVGVGHAVEGRLHGFGVEGRAIVELHAGAQLDGVDQTILAHGVAGGQHRHHLHVLVEAVEPLVEGLGHRLRERVVGIVGVGGREVGLHGHDHVLGGLRRHGETGQREGGCDSGKTLVHAKTPLTSRVERN
jgi:hypothetical protein